MQPARDLLVISDLHLGEGLAGKTDAVRALERALVDFLDHHRQDGRHWRLVVNGDGIDLVGITVLPAEAGDLVGLHPDDHTYGLGGRSHAATHKLGRVLLHHEEVFRALARFVGAGHELSLVLGNHDAELHWPDAQALLRDGLAALWTEEAAAGAEGARTADEVREAIAFHPWFFLEDGVAWIEHGHQYDPYCSFEEVLDPATDEEEIDPNVGALLLRYVGSRFAEDVHDAWGHGFWGYLRFAAAQGLSRFGAIVTGYLDMNRRLVSFWWQRDPARLAARAARARARLQGLARRFRVEESRLLEVARLRSRPVVADLSRLLQAVMLDRLALLVLGPAILLAPLLLLPWGWLPFGLLGVGLPLALWGRFAMAEREPADPRQTMRAMARRIREIARVPIVVMGHTHDPTVEGDGSGWYLNTGTWVPHGDRAFTHVRIERIAGGVRARLCQWRDGASRALEGEPVAVRVPAPGQ